MALACRVPLTDYETGILHTMPRVNGVVIHPAHVPAQHREAYLGELRTWCRKTPRRDWPKWLEEFVDLKRYEAQRDAARRPADDPDVPGLGAGDEPAAVPGLEGGEV